MANTTAFAKQLQRLLELAPHNQHLGLQFQSCDEFRVRTRSGGKDSPFPTDSSVIASCLASTAELAVLLRLGTLCKTNQLQLSIDHHRDYNGDLSITYESRCSSIDGPFAVVESSARQDEGGVARTLATARHRIMLLPARGFSE